MPAKPAKKAKAKRKRKPVEVCKCPKSSGEYRWDSGPCMCVHCDLRSRVQPKLMMMVWSCRLVEVK